MYLKFLNYKYLDNFQEFNSKNLINLINQELISKKNRTTFLNSIPNVKVALKSVEKCFYNT